MKNVVKLEIIVILKTDKHRDAEHSICILKYGQPKKIPIVFHNGSNYDRLSS